MCEDNVFGVGGGVGWGANCEWGEGWVCLGIGEGRVWVHEKRIME